MDNLRGSVIMIAAMALFALEDALIKSLAGSLPTGQILLFLGLVGTVVFGLMCRARGIAVRSHVFLNRAVVVRNLAEVLGTMTFVTALTLIPLATASAFIQAAPLMMTLGAASFLGESVGWRRWSAIVLGFFGVLIILRPGGESFDPNMLYALAGVVFLSIRDLASRRVPKSVPNLLLATYGFAMLLPAGSMLMLGSGGLVPPVPADMVKLAAVAAVGLIGYLAVTMASRMGDVSIVTPFRYTRLPFALALGLVAFGERPDLITLLGATLIVASGLYTLLREAHLRRSQR